MEIEMCDCRELFEGKATAHYPEIEGAAATLSGYMLIPSGYQYLECEVKGFRTTLAGKVIAVKKTINAMGSYCMFCGEKYEKDAPQ